MADWAALHVDILISILEKVRFIEDFAAFGSVCKSWREVAVNNKHRLGPQIPWLMLEYGDHCRQIYRLSKDDTSTENLYMSEMFGVKRIGLDYGWLLTVSPRGEMNLIHPLSRDRIHLPNGISLPARRISCAALSGNPSQSLNFVVMIVCAGQAIYLSYGRLGVQKWTPISTGPISDLIYYQNRFYGIDWTGLVWGFSVSDPSDCLPLASLRSICDAQYLIRNKKYIVVSEGDLLVVVKDYWNLSLSSDFGYHEFKVYKMDLIKGKHKQIKSLGDRSIFVGRTTSISVDVSEFRGQGLIRSNHIYLADVQVCCSLEDEQCKQFKVPRKRKLSSMCWFVPSF